MILFSEKCYKVLLSGFYLLLIWGFYACGSTRHLKENEFLLRKNQIKLQTTKTYAGKTALKEALQSSVAQQHNTYLLGAFPVKTWWYNLRYKRYQSDTANFQIRSGMAEAPVVFDRHSIALSLMRMQNLLLNEGYFDAKLSAKVDTVAKKKVMVTYTVDAQEEYLVDTIQFVADSSLLQSVMQPIWESKTLVKQAIPYSNSLLSEERSQMVNLAREQGFYRFNTDNIQFELDTMAQRKLRSKKSVVESAADVLAGKLKQTRPAVTVSAMVQAEQYPQAFDRYRFRNVYVYPEYVDNERFLQNFTQEQEANSYTFRLKSEQSPVRTGVISKKLSLKPGQIYRQSDYDKTLLQLNDLEIFNYARVFIVEDSAQQADGMRLLDAHVVLNPGRKYDFSTNFELSGGDLYLAGSALNASVINKNLFRGANQLSISANYGFELNQTKNTDQRFFERFYLMTQNFGLNTRLIAPDFVVPFRYNSSRVNSPQTVFNLGLNFLDRTNLFRLRTLNGGFGYRWKSGLWTTWQFNPLFFNALNLSNISDSFQVRLDEVQAIRNAYQENFILGEAIEFIHNTEGKRPDRHHFLRLGFEESGLLLKGVGAFRSAWLDKGIAFNYARYLRFDFDARQYFHRQSSTWAFRFYGGLGLPYGGAQTMPYVKQYFVGGAYSIRGWAPRLLGPGSYLHPAAINATDRLFVDQSGDLKLEFNAEYRFRMMQLFAGAIGLQGAFFVDAGNIWLMHPDANMPGAAFRWDKFYADLAMSPGLGLRADIGGFLILRADWAFAIKKPYERANNGWVIDQIDFGSRSWRNENLHLNLGIGFPF